MTDLIARLEAATEGSRELDMEIFWRVFPEYERGKDPIWHCLHYTTSIDAALTLVLRDWRVEHLGESVLNWNMWECELHNRNEDAAIQGDAATPALALCITALRARTPPTEETG